MGRYAFHRGYFVKRFPSNSLKISYFVPSLFVLYLLALSAAAAALGCSGNVSWLIAASIPAAAYLALTALSAFSLNPLTWLIVWAGIFATHAVYGIRFIEGLCARKAPCQYIGKDHA